MLHTRRKLPQPASNQQLLLSSFHTDIQRAVIGSLLNLLFNNQRQQYAGMQRTSSLPCWLPSAADWCGPHTRLQTMIQP